MKHRDSRWDGRCHADELSFAPPCVAAKGDSLAPLRTAPFTSWLRPLDGASAHGVGMDFFLPRPARRSPLENGATSKFRSARPSSASLFSLLFRRRGSGEIDRRGDLSSTPGRRDDLLSPVFRLSAARPWQHGWLGRCGRRRQRRLRRRRPGTPDLRGRRRSDEFEGHTPRATEAAIRSGISGLSRDVDLPFHDSSKPSTSSFRCYTE